jgi:two-component system cell cycle response regulator
MKNTKSIIFLLFFIFLIVMINSFFIIYLIQNNQTKNAYIINELGQIRGGTQRYSKLKLINKELDKIKFVENYINSKYTDIENIYKETIPTEAIDFFEKNLLELKKNWEKLKKAKNPKKIYILSENNWEIADPLVIYTAKAMENKTQKILFLIILISIISILTTLIIVFIIYNAISKNLNIKTLKNPLSNLYNLYHLNETLEILQNRYQRYGKKFAILKINLNKTNENKLKDIAKILKENIRKSDKIFHSKNKIIILLLEPNQININKFSKRLSQMLSKIIKNQKIEIKIYNGEKIEDFI